MEHLFFYFPIRKLRFGYAHLVSNSVYLCTYFKCQCICWLTLFSDFEIATVCVVHSCLNKNKKMDFIASSHLFPVFLPQDNWRLCEVGGAQAMSKCIVESPSVLGAVEHVVATSAVPLGMWTEVSCAVQCGSAVSVRIAPKTRVSESDESLRLLFYFP